MVSQLRLSTVCTLPKSESAKQRRLPRQTQTGLAVPSLCGDQEWESLPTVRQTRTLKGESRHVVSKLCLSTVCRLPTSSQARQQPRVPCQASPLLAMRQVRPSKLSDVPCQSLRPRCRRRTRRRVPTVCGTGSQVRKMQTANGRPPAFTRLVPRVCLSALRRWLRRTASEYPRSRSRQIQATVDVPDLHATHPTRGPAKRRMIQNAEQADTLPPLPPPAQPPDDSASPAAPFSQPKRRKAESKAASTAPCATPAQTTPALRPAAAGAVPQPPDDSSVSRPAVLLCQPRKRKRGVASANLESFLPAPVPETVLPDS